MWIKCKFDQNCLIFNKFNEFEGVNTIYINFNVVKKVYIIDVKFIKSQFIIAIGDIDITY